MLQCSGNMKLSQIALEMACLVLSICEKIWFLTRVIVAVKKYSIEKNIIIFADFGIFIKYSPLSTFGKVVFCTKLIGWTELPITFSISYGLEYVLGG